MGKYTGLRNRFNISDRVEIGGVEIKRVNCIIYVVVLGETKHKYTLTINPLPGSPLESIPPEAPRVSNYSYCFFCLCMAEQCVQDDCGLANSAEPDQTAPFSSLIKICNVFCGITSNH